MKKLLIIIIILAVLFLTWRFVIPFAVFQYYANTNVFDIPSWAWYFIKMMNV